MQQSRFLEFIADIPPELFASLLKPSFSLETIDSNVFPAIPTKRVHFPFKKKQSAYIMFRGVCKKVQNCIENLPALRLQLSMRGVVEADRKFFRQFRSLNIFAAHGWESSQWLDALVEETKHGLVIECLAISASDQNLASLVSKLQPSAPTAIKKVEITFHGHAHSLESSIDCFESLSRAVGSVALDVTLGVDKELETPGNVYGCFEALASTATIVRLWMK